MSLENKQAEVRRCRGCCRDGADCTCDHRKREREDDRRRVKRHISECDDDPSPWEQNAVRELEDADV